MAKRNKVTRWDFDVNADTMVPAENGDYVEVGDFKKIEKENAKLRKQVKKLEEDRNLFARDLRLLVCGMKNGALRWLDDEGRKIVRAVHETIKEQSVK